MCLCVCAFVCMCVWCVRECGRVCVGACVQTMCLLICGNAYMTCVCSIPIRNPLKVMNVLVHGDTRSHVVLCPPYITAGSNLVLECVMITLNQIYEDHGVMPKVLNVQLDNASVNKSAVMVGFAALLVFSGVLEVVCTSKLVRL